MLELRPSCENCGRALPPDSADARICSFECTFCAHCVETVLHNVCPNCGGGLEVRPVRPQAMLERRPASGERVQRPVDEGKFASLLARYRDVPPHQR